MRTRSVTLQTGIRAGERTATVAEIREETLDDELRQLESGRSGLLAHRLTLMDRVSRIGDLDNPAPEVVRKLTRTDWELLERAMQELDHDLAVEAGLIDAEGNAKAGRDEPGEAAEGDA